MNPNIEEKINALQNALKKLVAELRVANWQSIELWTELDDDLQKAKTENETPEQIALRLSHVDSLALGYGRGAIREFGISDELVDAVWRALQLAKAECDGSTNEIEARRK